MVRIEEVQNMGKGRLEAFSDGVIAIIITIMVLDLKTPAGDDPAATGGTVELPVWSETSPPTGATGSDSAGMIA